VFWWHPLAWLFCRVHAEACEEACDTAAASLIGDPAAYSQTLARVALWALKPSPAVAGLPMARPAQLMHRLARLAGCLDASRPSLRRAGPAVALGAVAAVALSALQFVHAAPAPAARVLHFPADRSLGTLSIQDANLKRDFRLGFRHRDDDGVTSQWRVLGEARGDVAIPAGQRVSLSISREGSNDLSPLKKLAPDDIYELGFAFTAERDAGDAVMTHVAHLTGTRILSLGWTQMGDEALHHIEQFKSLECLTLPPRTTDLGLAHTAKLTGLKRLYFSNNTITDQGLAKLATLRNLEELELGGEQISDAGLVHLAKLPKLRFLSLWGSQFTDAGMAHVSRIRSLQTFSAPSTIGDEGLTHLASMPNLERLNLHRNENITDQGMARVAWMPALRQLDIGKTRVSDAGLAHLQRPKNLEFLELPWENVTEAGLLSLLGTQNNLRHLVCDGSSRSTYSDEVLRLIGNMPHLERLMVAGAQYTDEGVAELARCGKLRRLIIMFSPITNKSLVTIGRLKELEFLQITNSKATTSGLAALNDLKNLKSLMINPLDVDNGFMDVSGLTRLEHLDLRCYSEHRLRDADLACLAKLERLNWLITDPSSKISDLGLNYLKRLKNVTSLSIGGTGVTDAGLTHLSGMKNLDHLTISGSISERGLSELARQNPTISMLAVSSTRKIGLTVMMKKLKSQLPRLINFVCKQYPDLPSPMDNDGE
jgi:Leucine-rich repeat (LRR) protein